MLYPKLETDENVVNSARQNNRLNDEYDEFSEPKPTRNFQIVADSRVFHVNPGWLAELSSFFEYYCFVEVGMNSMPVEGCSQDEMLEFLRCIFYCPMRKSLTDSNIQLIYTLAARFNMIPVMARCDNFILKRIISWDKERLVQMIRLLSCWNPYSQALGILVDKLVCMKQNEFDDALYASLPGEVVADIFKQRKRLKMSWLRKLRRLLRKSNS